MLAGCTAGLMVPGFLHGEEKLASTTAATSDRLGKFLPVPKLGSSGAVVTSLGVGGDHVGSVSVKDAQAIIEKALEEGVRFFDNAPLYSSGIAEERYENVDLRTFLRRRQGSAAYGNLCQACDTGGFLQGGVWSLPVATLISGMECSLQVSQDAALARKT